MYARYTKVITLILEMDKKDEWTILLKEYQTLESSSDMFLLPEKKGQDSIFIPEENNSAALSKESFVSCGFVETLTDIPRGKLYYSINDNYSFKVEKGGKKYISFKNIIQKKDFCIALLYLYGVQLEDRPYKSYKLNSNSDIPMSIGPSFFTQQKKIFYYNPKFHIDSLLRAQRDIQRRISESK